MRIFLHREPRRLMATEENSEADCLLCLQGHVRMPRWESMWSLMQWWSNPTARSHLEAWVNIWVRSAGLALVIAGCLLV